jgi:tRNA dimethylallyltransferase
MEVYILTGETITEHDRRTAARPPRFDSVRYALTFRDRETLYGRIRLRVDDMVRRGLFEETRSLLEAGVSPDATAMQAIGYKEAAAALRGECTREEAAEMIKRASTRYAKRQLTWLRRDTDLRWIFREDRPDPERTAEEILRELKRE